MICRTRRGRRRRGFSLTVVLLFLLLLMYLWAVAFRTTGSLVRVQTARVLRDQEDAGLRNALARTLMFVEQDAAKQTPTLDHSAGPYRYTIKVTNDRVARWTIDNQTTFAEASGPTARYTATITPDPSGPKRWTIEVTAYEPSSGLPELPAN